MKCEVFLSYRWLLKLDSKLLSYDQTFVCLQNNNNLDATLWEKTGDIDFKVLQESLMNLPVLALPNYQITFFLFVYKKEVNDFGMLTPKHRDHHRQIGYYSQQLDPVV